MQIGQTVVEYLTLFFFNLLYCEIENVFSLKVKLEPLQWNKALITDHFSSFPLISPHLYLHFLKCLHPSVRFCLCLSCSPLTARFLFFPGSVWSCLCERVPVFVCVPSVLTSRRVDPLTVIPLPNLRGVSGGACSARY